jgi:hypothetical protein
MFVPTVRTVMTSLPGLVLSRRPGHTISTTWMIPLSAQPSM